MCSVSENVELSQDYLTTLFKATHHVISSAPRERRAVDENILDEHQHRADLSAGPSPTSKHPPTATAAASAVL